MARRRLPQVDSTGSPQAQSPRSTQVTAPTWVTGSTGSPSQVNVLILGLGNPLRRDDGVGPRVIEELKAGGLPEGVTALDGGAGGLDLLQVMDGWDDVVVVDAANVDMDGRLERDDAVTRSDPVAEDSGCLAPGEFVRFTPQQARLSESPRDFSFHHAGLADVLALAGALDRPLPSIVIFGVQPRDVGWGEGLSPDIEAKLPALIDAVLEEAIRRVKSRG